MAERDVKAAALKKKHQDVVFSRFIFGVLAMLVLLACTYRGVTAARAFQGWARVVVIAVSILPGVIVEAMAFREYNKLWKNSLRKSS